MNKVIVIAGHSDSDPGAVANGYREADLTKEFREMLITVLRYYQVDYGKQLTIKRDCDELSLARVVNWLNSLTEKNRLILDIHFNAFNSHANGTEVFIPDNYSEDELELGRKISQCIADTLGVLNRGVKTESRSARKRLAIMRPKGINLLLEMCFIDNIKDIEKYHKHKTELAIRIGKIILEHDYVRM